MTNLKFEKAAELLEKMKAIKNVMEQLEFAQKEDEHMFLNVRGRLAGAEITKELGGMIYVQAGNLLAETRVEFNML